MNTKRRDFLRSSAAAAGAFLLPSHLLAQDAANKKSGPRRCSRSRSPSGRYHKALFAEQMDNLDFPAKCKETSASSGVEYVNQFFKDKATDMDYLKQLKSAHRPRA